MQLEANDGELTSADEITVTVYPAGTINQAPNVTTGYAQTINFPDIVNLDAIVTDDGLPLSTEVTTTWLQMGGPGTVTFSNASAISTTASFPSAGIYFLRLTADDGNAIGYGDITIIVNPAPEVLDIRVSASSDDAEERASGTMNLTSSDLELVEEKGIQTVGMRFNGLTIPPGMMITEAYIQFQVDETSSKKYCA